MIKLAVGSMKPNTLKRRLETVHAECVGKTLEFFDRKLNEFNKQEEAFPKITTIKPKTVPCIIKCCLQDCQM
jgi:hypothetical protein